MTKTLTNVHNIQDNEVQATSQYQTNIQVTYGAAAVTTICTANTPFKMIVSIKYSLVAINMFILIAKNKHKVKKHYALAEEDGQYFY